jgi:DHA1 family bicyclomycin/chloramphenicol resistance-like MFS transporter
VRLPHLLAAEAMSEGIWRFVILQGLTMSFFGLIGANAGALAMEPLGHIAGTASSVRA